MKQVLVALLVLSLLGGCAPDALSPPVLSEEQTDWALNEAGYPWLDYDDLAKYDLAISILPYENGSGGLVIFGTADFVKAVWRSFNLMNAYELAFVRENTRSIQIPALGDSRAVVQKGITYISDRQIKALAKKFDDSTDVILAGALIHEATHHYDWKSCRPAAGVDAEARAISQELAFYSRHDVGGWAQWQQEQIGSHGVDKDPGDWINPQCGNNPSRSKTGWHQLAGFLFSILATNHSKNSSPRNPYKLTQNPSSGRGQLRLLFALEIVRVD